MCDRPWSEIEAEAKAAGRLDEAAVNAHQERMRAEQRAYRLAEIRKERGMTQTDVAAEMHVTRGTGVMAVPLPVPRGVLMPEMTLEELQEKFPPENREEYDRAYAAATLAGVDPLTAECPACLQPPGSACRTQTGRPARTHKLRARLALAMAAHADPALDDKGLGPVSACLICGSGLPQRHRMVDAIAGHLSAGEYPEEIADELAQSVAAVLCVQEWMQRWPGAWR